MGGERQADLSLGYGQYRYRSFSTEQRGACRFNHASQFAAVCAVGSKINAVFLFYFILYMRFSYVLNPPVFELQYVAQLNVVLASI